MSITLKMYIPRTNMRSLICITAIWTFASQLKGREKYFWKTQYYTFAKWQSKSSLLHFNLFQNSQCQASWLDFNTWRYDKLTWKYPQVSFFFLPPLFCLNHYVCKLLASLLKSMTLKFLFRKTKLYITQSIKSKIKII